MAAEYGRLPHLLTLRGVRRAEQDPLARWGAGDEYLGTYGDEKVVLKGLRKLETKKGNLEKARDLFSLILHRLMPR